MAGIKKLLGTKIANMRKDKGFSQMDFAEKLGISTNALSLIETGNGFFTAETLEKILQTLNIEPDELFTFGGTKSNDEIYQNILKNLNQIKSNRTKLTTIDTLLKTLL